MHCIYVGNSARRVHKNQVDDVKELQQRVETVLMSEAVSECSSERLQACNELMRTFQACSLNTRTFNFAEMQLTNILGRKSFVA